MSKRSMAITEPEKIKNVEEKNSENRKPQSVQEDSYLSSAVKHNKGGAKNK